jgi:hypothetical protein
VYATLASSSGTSVMTMWSLTTPKSAYLRGVRLRAPASPRGGGFSLGATIGHGRGQRSVGPMVTEPEPEACACPLCDAEAMGREGALRSEIKCVTCGRFSITHDAARALDELPDAGRAVICEALRAHIKVLHAQVDVPLVLEQDVRAVTGWLA